MDDGIYLFTIFEHLESVNTIPNNTIIVRLLVKVKTKKWALCCIDCDDYGYVCHETCPNQHWFDLPNEDENFHDVMVDTLITYNRQVFFKLTVFNNKQYKWEKFKLCLGQHYANIYRPNLSSAFMKQSMDSLCDYDVQYYEDLPIIGDIKYYNELNQLETIIDMLCNVFKVIAPSTDNLKAFGNELRNLIVLACTEVDALFKGIFVANGVPNNKGKFDKYNTKNYVDLLDPLKLKEYSVAFVRYPDLGIFNPFDGWNKENPSTSLSWYDAYNKLKHNRETCFSYASLENAIGSVLALAIVFIAQYGYRNDLWREKVGKVIRVVHEPLWAVSDCYIKVIGKGESVNYPIGLKE